jgi:hypothetical protein
MARAYPTSSFRTGCLQINCLWNLNKTAEVAKGIGSGAADVLGNITGEIQQGISAKK